MKIQNLFNKAKVNNWPYFFMAIDNSYSSSILEKDNSLAFCFKKLYISFCRTTYAKREVVLAVNNEFSSIEERKEHINEVIAHSFSKAYGIPVIMGIGNNKPRVYKKLKETLLQKHDFIYLLDLLTGKGDINEFKTKHFQIANKDEYFIQVRRDFLLKVKQFGIDVIPAFIVSTYIRNKKAAPWIEQLKVEITNHRAKTYIKTLKINNLSYSM